MRIISGKFRNKPLKTPNGLNTRPTTSRVKESVFNIIQFNILDSDVLDLFSGSGQMGLECLSRGARSCDFVDSNKGAYDTILQNMKSCGVTEKAYFTDYINFLKTIKKRYDIIFLDPPYSTNILNDAIFLINNFKLLNDCGIIICETSLDDEICVKNTDFHILKSYKYGTINITILKIKEE